MSAPEPTFSESPTGQLYAKLLKIGKAIHNIEKRGRNAHHDYDYVQAVDVVRDVRKLLHREKLILLPGTLPGSVKHDEARGGRGMVTTVDLVYRIVDTEGGALVELPWTAAGSDVGGDKGVYKAYTGGLKYALLSLFLIPTGDDPETDRQTASGREEGQHERGGTTADDAERPAAPRIPLDRATAILARAKAVGLVNDDDSFSPVLKAQLQTLGVDKIGALDVDQAEAMEAFLAEEAPDAPAGP